MPYPTPRARSALNCRLKASIQSIYVLFDDSERQKMVSLHTKYVSKALNVY
jgi:hypothetical protein